MRDLQRRLVAAGAALTRTEADGYCQGTEQAVRSFQDEHGLPADGRCDLATWEAIVEAGYRLGDRTLYARRPMPRGDDVAELQRRLGNLGFNAGKVDGIFGPLTDSALTEFQRNVGLGPDGICGWETVQALDRLGNRRATDVSIASVLETESLRHAPRTLTGRRVAVGHLGGLGAAARALGRELRAGGAIVLTLDEPDPSLQAEAANRFGADVYLALRTGTATTATSVWFYAAKGYESSGGKRLALEVETQLRAVVADLSPAPVGMRIALLRETRMPAVAIDLGTRALALPPYRLVHALVTALKAWVTDPLDDESPG